jgi:hypothetical protein
MACGPETSPKGPLEGAVPADAGCAGAPAAGKGRPPAPKPSGNGMTRIIVAWSSSSSSGCDGSAALAEAAARLAVMSTGARSAAGESCIIVA